MIKVKEAADSVRFSVRVQPRASRTEILGEWQGALRVCLAEPPVDDRANEALRRLLAARLKLPVSAGTLVRGEHCLIIQFEVHW
ncbi:MAG: DUF167 domain-containing protein, partial [Terracidiphilus sp.]